MAFETLINYLNFARTASGCNKAINPDPRLFAFAQERASALAEGYSIPPLQEATTKLIIDPEKEVAFSELYVQVSGIIDPKELDSAGNSRLLLDSLIKKPKHKAWLLGLDIIGSSLDCVGIGIAPRRGTSETMIVLEMASDYDLLCTALNEEAKATAARALLLTSPSTPEEQEHAKEVRAESEKMRAQKNAAIFTLFNPSLSS